MNANSDPELKPATYQWAVRLFTIVKRLLRVNIKMHHVDGQLEDGDIFLFNHFARFETFIPQYLIYKETGAYCRSVADSRLFAEDDSFSNYLLSLGAVPNDYPRLLPLLAEEILRGRKVVIFPEGGMVKDRLVQDSAGRYLVYSRTAAAWRVHHTGAAVLAVLVDAFKLLIRDAYLEGQMGRLQAWADALRMESAEALLLAARRPTRIIPANITFYPIQVDDNILRKGAEILKKGLSRRASEELLIEGNLLLRDTDMDIRLGPAISVSETWRWWQHKLVERVGRRLASLDELCSLKIRGDHLDGRLLARLIRRKSAVIRDDYMHRIYQGVTVNLSHLAACLVMSFVSRGVTEIEKDSFHRAVYFAVKYLQREPTVHLHRSLRNPELYAGIVENTCTGLRQFMATAEAMGLVGRDGIRYRLLPKLLEQHELDVIRLENLVTVYANEVGPVAVVRRCIERALIASAEPAPRTLAGMRFDDALVAYRWDRWYFTKPRYQEINRLETAVESGEPFLLVPEAGVNLGVVLIHGFLASPAEMRRFGEKLKGLGYPVIGVRLKGHGTSPCDLRERSRRDWLESVRQGFSVMSAFAERICLVGFSTGGALALKFAAEQPEGLAGVAGIAVPLKFRSQKMRLVPLLHGANQFVRWVSSAKGVMPFHPNNPENPHINYRSIPIRGLYELRHLVDELQATLPNVRCPVALLQGTDDPLIDPASAELIYDKLGSKEKTLTMVSSGRHAILYDDIGGTQETIETFLKALASDPSSRRPPKMLMPVTVPAETCS